jgi:hypothetical protein
MGLGIALHGRCRYGLLHQDLGNGKTRYIRWRNTLRGSCRGFWRR